MVRNAYLVVNRLNMLDRRIAELQVRIDDLKNQKSMIVHEAKDRILPELIHDQSILTRLVSRIQEEC
jgi:hypothetical protein